MKSSRMSSRLCGITSCLLFVYALGAPSVEAGVFGGCVDERTAVFKPNQVPNNCTANDVTFNAIGLGTQSNGCVAPGDQVDIQLGGTVRNTTAQTRYDVGLYIATDGDPNGDGARTGSCYRQHFTPLGPQNGFSCPAQIDLDSGTGPYLNTDGDSCGDLINQSGVGCDENNDGFWDDSFIIFPDPVTLPCEDNNANGFVEIPTCATWGNQSGEIGSGSGATDACDGVDEIIPGTKAKCRCEDLESTIPVPNLSLSCSCNPTTIGQGEATQCTVTYLNSVTCTPDPATPERFRCGTGSFLRFEVDYDESRGATSTLGTTGAGTTSDNGSLITWVPRNQLPGNTLGVIGPNNQSSTLSFTYTADPDVTNGTATVATRTYWSNTSPTDPAAVLQSTLSCSFDITTTPVTLAWARARREGSGAVLEWTTATETGNLGFHVYARGEQGGWDRVTDDPIPSHVVSSTEPQSYRLELDDAATAYRIEDVGVDGRRQRHPVVELGRGVGATPKAEAVDWQAVRADNRQASRSRRPLRAVAAAKGGNGQGNGGAAAAPAVDLAVDTTGLHRVTHEELAAAGFDFSAVRGRDLVLAAGGRPVALRVEAAKAGKMGPGSYVEFWGEALDSLYTGTNVYTLTTGRDGVAVGDDATTAAAPGVGVHQATVRIERDRTYNVGVPGDPWVDSLLMAFRSPRSFGFDVEVDALAASESGPHRLEVELYGVTSFDSVDPDHHARLWVNDQAVGDVRFDGAGGGLFTVDLASGVLVEGSNRVVVELPADTGAASDAVALESYSVSYPRHARAREGVLVVESAALAVTVDGLPGPEVAVWRLSGDAPARLSGAEVTASGGAWSVTFAGDGTPAHYAVVADAALRTPGISAHRAAEDLLSGEARWLAIAHPAFLDGAEELADLRRAEGWSVDVVDVEAVYATYGHGIVDAAAIRDYVAEAVALRGTEVVVLVGGDTYDYRDRLGIGSVSYVPSLYAETGTLVRHAPADPLYGDIDRDGVPDVAVGRLPVRTADELSALVAKISAYADKPYERTVVAAADYFDDSNTLSFSASADRFMADLGAGWQTTRAYLDRDGVATARAILTGAVAEGRALTTYVGHSGPTAWTFSGLFRTTDAAALDNPGRPTVVVQWGCWNTYYVQPTYNTLGHRLLLSDDRGAAAVLGATTLVQHSSSEALGRELAPLLAQPGTTLGEALVTAKRRVAAVSQQRTDVLIGWTLLGDPATVVVEGGL